MDSYPPPPWRRDAEAEQSEASRGAVQPARGEVTRGAGQPASGSGEGHLVEECAGTCFPDNDARAAQEGLVHPTSYPVLTLQFLSLNIGLGQDNLSSRSSWTKHYGKLFRLLGQFFASYKPDFVCLSEVGGYKQGPTVQGIDLGSLLGLDLGSCEVACQASFVQSTTTTAAR